MKDGGNSFCWWGAASCSQAASVPSPVVWPAGEPTGVRGASTPNTGVAQLEKRGETLFDFRGDPPGEVSCGRPCAPKHSRQREGRDGWPLCSLLQSPVWRTVLRPPVFPKGPYLFGKTGALGEA